MGGPDSRLKAWTPNAREAVRSLALQGEARLASAGGSHAQTSLGVAPTEGGGRSELGRSAMQGGR